MDKINEATETSDRGCEWSIEFKHNEGCKSYFFEQFSPLAREILAYNDEVEKRIREYHKKYNCLFMKDKSIMFDETKFNRMMNIDIYSFMNTLPNEFLNRLNEFVEKHNAYLIDFEYGSLQMTSLSAFYVHIKKFEYVIFSTIAQFDLAYNTLLSNGRFKTNPRLIYIYAREYVKLINSSMKTYLYSIFTLFLAYYSVDSMAKLMNVKTSVLGTEDDSFKYFFIDPLIENKEKYSEIHSYCVENMKSKMKKIRRKYKQSLFKQKISSVILKEKLIIRKMFSPIGFDPFARQKYAEQLIEAVEDIKKSYTDSIKSYNDKVKEMIDESDKSASHFIDFYIPDTTDYKNPDPYFTEVLKLIRETKCEHSVTVPYKIPIENDKIDIMSHLTTNFDSDIRRSIEGRMKKIMEEHPDITPFAAFKNNAETADKLMKNTKDFTSYITNVEIKINNSLRSFMKSISNTYYMLH